MARPRLHSQDGILAAAAQVFREHGVVATTAQIAQAAQVSNGTLFNYYPTKQVLIDALYIWLKEDLSEAVGVIEPTLSSRSQFYLVWERWMQWASSFPDRHAVIHLLYNARLVSDKAHRDSSKFFEVPARILAQAVASGKLVDLPSRYLAEHMEQQLNQASVAGLDNQTSERAFNMMWAGIQR